ncbi:DUF7352 domain-containing protein [Hahella sp. HN01]|uniref:DUF7352 domain-containing protein n=1 Tax=unclassified Hahella TaxID=2624107 RepID=UPI0020A6BBED|nr:hypothetical protein [Hahella sp. HN01]
MMKAIHKYRLEGPQTANRIMLREGSRIVRSEYLVTEKAVFIWVEEPLAVEIPSQPRLFYVVMSGEPVPENYCHLDTALDPFGPEAYHVFEAPEASRNLSAA